MNPHHVQLLRRPRSLSQPGTLGHDHRQESGSAQQHSEPAPRCEVRMTVCASSAATGTPPHRVSLVGVVEQALQLRGQQRAAGQLVGQQERHALVQAVVHQHVAVHKTRQARLHLLRSVRNTRFRTPIVERCMMGGDSTSPSVRIWHVASAQRSAPTGAIRHGHRGRAARAFARNQQLCSARSVG